MNQHLIRSIVAIRAQGGVALKNGDRVMPDPILVGRNEVKLAERAKAHGITMDTTSMAALKNKMTHCSSMPPRRSCAPKAAASAIARRQGHLFEKPIARRSRDALDVARAAKKAGIRHGRGAGQAVPAACLKLKVLIDSGFFGRILAVRGEFGYWVFEGGLAARRQRPSWNYRKRMARHHPRHAVSLRYVLDNLFGEVKSVSC